MPVIVMRMTNAEIRELYKIVLSEYSYAYGDRGTALRELKCALEDATTETLPTEAGNEEIESPPEPSVTAPGASRRLTATELAARQRARVKAAHQTEEEGDE